MSNDTVTVEVKNIRRLDMGPVQPEHAAILKECMECQWELVPEGDGFYRLIAHANLGFKMAPYVVLKD